MGPQASRRLQQIGGLRLPVTTPLRAHICTVASLLGRVTGFPTAFEILLALETLNQWYDAREGGQ